MSDQNQSIDAALDIRVLDNAARDAASDVAVTRGIVRPTDLAQMADHAKFMSQSREAVPKHLRGNVGMCVAITEMAMEWGFRAYGVANVCYVVNDRLGFEAQLMIAIANKHAGLTQRLRPIYEGDGPGRVCIIRARFTDEVDPCEYRSPEVGTISPKNSPLWKVDPDRQLFYYSARAFVRMYCPQVMLGIFGTDEILDHVGFDRAKDVTGLAQDPVAPGLHDRLAAAQHPEADGYRDGVVDAGLNGDHDPAPPAPKRGRGRPRKDAPATETITQPAAKDEPAPIGNDTAKELQGDNEPDVILPPTKTTSVPATPRNPAEYADHVRLWLETSANEDETESRWSSERKLRNACGITEDERKPIRALVDARLAVLSEAAK